jgi:beta-aspartyl-peptidase (threonine type)
MGLSVVLAASQPLPGPTSAKAPKVALAIHGGAGTILKKNMTPEQEAQYVAKLNEALEAGHRVLTGGGTSLQAVEAAIKIMEDSPLFNAGKGAVFTHEGKNELDAAVMDGKTLAAGAVAGVTTIKNPISAALAVMQKSPHVMMTGRGAELFAQQQGVEMVDPSYFYDERRFKQLEKAKEREKVEGSENNGQGRLPGDSDPLWLDRKFGTVGCVALDQFGNLAAGTSTGGMTNKKFGRVGDAPIIGAGTYADNATCAVSATGHGEYFIRAVVAHDVAARMAYQKLPLAKAAHAVVMEKLVKMGGEGGIIAIDGKGNIAMPFNSEGMYRACIRPDGTREVKIYKE